MFPCYTTNVFFFFFFKALRLLCVPYGLKSHQMRPEDFNERTLANLEQERGGFPSHQVTPNDQILSTNEERSQGQDNFCFTDSHQRLQFR